MVIKLQSDSTISSDRSPRPYLSIGGWLSALVCWPLLSLKLWDFYALSYTYNTISIVGQLDDIDRVECAPFTLQHGFMGLTQQYVRIELQDRQQTIISLLPTILHLLCNNFGNNRVCYLYYQFSCLPYSFPFFLFIIVLCNYSYLITIQVHVYCYFDYHYDHTLRCLTWR